MLCSAQYIFITDHELDVAAVCLGDEPGLVALAADPLRAAVLDGALQLRPRARRVPQAEEPGPSNGAINNWA